MAAHEDTLSSLIVAHASLRKLLVKDGTPLQTAPSSRTFPPSAERDLLTFIAAVCSLYFDCDEAAVAIARGVPISGDATLYVATVQTQTSTIIQRDLHRFVHELCVAYNPSSHAVGSTCEDRILMAMYRFSYTALRRCLWNDHRFPQVSRYFEEKVTTNHIKDALEKLKNMTKESNPVTISNDIFKAIHEECGVIYTFARERVMPGPLVSGFLTDVVGVRIVASQFHPMISGDCLADEDVKSLTESARGRDWEVVCVPSPTAPSAPFETEVSNSAVAAWLKEYSQCSKILPWPHTISRIASTCPEPLTKTGSRYTSDEPPSFHSEIILLLWLFHHKIAIDMHIGCSSVVCYACSKLAQALGAVYPRYDVALSDAFDSTTIELPWICPPDVPVEIREKLQAIILEDFQRDALTYVSEDGFYQDALGLELPEFPPIVI